MSTVESDPLVIRERLAELFRYPNLLPEPLLAFLVDYLAVNMPEIPFGHIIGSAESAGTELLYSEFTSPVSVTATVEASADTLVSASAYAFNGTTPVLIEFYCPKAQQGSVYTNAVLFDDSSPIGWLAEIQATTAPVYTSRRLKPSAASHTYSIRAYNNNANPATWTAGAGGAGNYMPGFIRITRG